MRWIKITLINLSVLFVLFVLAEVGMRVAWIARSCWESQCDFTLITQTEIDFQHINLSRPDEKLGYTLREGTTGFLFTHKRDKKTLKISEEGLRVNKTHLPRSGKDILAAGDSFTYGTQVSNHETWPSCLQERTGVRVDNIGVPGYGTAQALLRAQGFADKYEYATVILSTLVAEDFKRDQHSYRRGFPRPAVIHTEKGTSLVPPPDLYREETRFNPKKANLVTIISKHSMLYTYLSKRIGFIPKKQSSDHVSLVHPQAASIPQIIDWTLREFAALASERKILLLQYTDPFLIPLPDVLKERAEILEAARAHKDILVVDTYSVVHSGDDSQIWSEVNKHHTPYGNDLVCEALFEQAFG